MWKLCISCQGTKKKTKPKKKFIQSYYGVVFQVVTIFVTKVNGKKFGWCILAKVAKWPICVQMPHRNLKGLHLSKTFMIYMHSHKPVPGCCHFLFPYSSVESWDVKLSEPYNDCWLLWCCLQLWWLFSDFQLPNGKNILNLECLRALSWKPMGK